MVSIRQLKLSIRKRWFFSVAVAFCAIATQLGLMRSKADPAYRGGFQLPEDRAASWLAQHALVIEAGE